jgi:type I restriction enzyme S subunit
MLNVESNSLPSGWVLAKLEDCVDILDSQRVPVNRSDRKLRKGNVPYYGATGQVDWIDDYLFDEELLLLGEDGAPFYEFGKRKAYLVSGKSWVNNHAHVLRAVRTLTSNAFLCNYLNIFDFHGYVSGTTRLKLNQGPMRKIPVSLPPMPEQNRLVLRMEELISRLDSGVDSLRKAEKRSVNLRHSILVHTYAGKLIEQDPTDISLKDELANVRKQRLESRHKPKHFGKMKPNARQKELT